MPGPKRVENFEEIKGIIVPMEWSRDGKVIGIGVSTNREQEYAIEKDSVYFRDLIKLIQQSVIVSGTIEETARGKKTLNVENYQLVLMSS
ncbi:hypothetical protein ACFL5V_08420 [Fibrobacterota bacterium]